MEEVYGTLDMRMTSILWIIVIRLCEYLNLTKICSKLIFSAHPIYTYILPFPYMRFY